jgi:hypothetical protein
MSESFSKVLSENFSLPDRKIPHSNGNVFENSALVPVALTFR